MPVNKIPTRQLGRNGPTVGAVGLGLMTIRGAFYTGAGAAEEEEITKAINHAVERGITLFDTANVYPGSEIWFGNYLKATGVRNKIFICTKFGGGTPEPVPSWNRNSKPSHIREQLEISLSKLQIDCIDLYYQHRVDPEVPIEVVVNTLGEYIDKGKIRYIGLSECSIDTLRRAKAVPKYGEKVIAAQMEFSPFTLVMEKNGFLKAAEELGVGVVAYSPLARGLVSGRFRSRADFAPDDWRLGVPRFSEENFPNILKVVDALSEIAKKYPGATSSSVTLAWIMAEHKNIIPLPGSRSVDRVEDICRGAELKLDPADVKTIRDLVENMDIGYRYALDMLGSCMDDSLPLDQWKGE